MDLIKSFRTETISNGSNFDQFGGSTNLQETLHMDIMIYCQQSWSGRHAEINQGLWSALFNEVHLLLIYIMNPQNHIFYPLSKCIIFCEWIQTVSIPIVLTAKND